MTEEFLLTPTDVAEALGCDLGKVLDLIESGAIVAQKSRGWKVTHRDLARFISEERRAGLALGHEVRVSTSFLHSRPFN